jgi:hypothetical protein
MRVNVSIGAMAIAASLAFTLDSVRAVDNVANYPDWKGQWIRRGGVTNAATWDPEKPWGLKQEPPLTPEYQAIFEASIKDQAAGGQGSDPSFLCHSHGMPRIMLAVQPMELVITPETTYIIHEIFSTLRRIYTDGRDWPESMEGSMHGYSIGKWEDADGDGRFDTLVVETRGISGPRSFDNSGIPLHKNNQTVVYEKIYADRANSGVIFDEITTVDSALTRPWTVKRSYRRLPIKQPVWTEYICGENNRHVQIGSENYVLGADSLLMPTRKNQMPPDLRHFQ